MAASAYLKSRRSWFDSILSHQFHVPVAQLVEHWPEEPGVEGSNPSGYTNLWPHVVMASIALCLSVGRGSNPRGVANKWLVEFQRMLL